MQWLFFEQYSHEPFIATARYWTSILKQPEHYAEQLVHKHRLGNKALQVMEQHLQSQNFLVNNQYTIADIALYAYTHVATEGGFDLQGYPHICLWLERIAKHPRHVLISNG